MENQNPQTSQITSSKIPVAQSNKWYKHKGILAIIILAAIATVSIWIYLTLNQPQNLGPIVIHHKVDTNSQTNSQVSNRIAFLKSGEVWLANEDGSSPIQLTNASGTISGFSTSPQSSYLEYETNNGETDIFDLKTQKIIRKITLKDFKLLPADMTGNTQFITWISDSQFEVSLITGGAYSWTNQDMVIDINTQRPVYATTTDEYSQPSASFTTTEDVMKAGNFTPSAAAGDYFGFADFSTPHYYNIYQVYYPFIFYGITPSNNQLTPVSLHVFNITTKQDKTIGELSMGGGAQYNHSRDNIAFLNEKVYQPGDSVFQNQLWLYNNNNPINLYSVDSTLPGMFQWSFDDKFIALRTDKFSGTLFASGTGELVIVDVSYQTNPKVIKIIDHIDFDYYSGLQWTRDGKILYTDNGNIYIYDLKTDTAKLFMEKASEPISL